MPQKAGPLLGTAVKASYFAGYSSHRFFMNICFVCKNLYAMKIFHSKRF